MNERFKFRAWLKDAKVMVDVEQIDFYNNTIAYIFDNYAEVEQEWIDTDIKNVELLQYTGNNDKKDAEIYEKYIVEDEYNRKYIVVFKGDCWRCEPLSRGLKNRWISNDLMVIGNIYENPDLLEATK